MLHSQSNPIFIVFIHKGMNIFLGNYKIFSWSSEKNVDVSKSAISNCTRHLCKVQRLSTLQYHLSRAYNDSDMELCRILISVYNLHWTVLWCQPSHSNKYDYMYSDSPNKWASTSKILFFGLFEWKISMKEKIKCDNVLWQKYAESLKKWFSIKNIWSVRQLLLRVLCI